MFWRKEHSHPEIANLEERVQRAESQRFEMMEYLSALRVMGILPAPPPLSPGAQVFYSTAEPAPCGCLVHWSGSPKIGGQGRVVTHQDWCAIKQAREKMRKEHGITVRAKE